MMIYDDLSYDLCYHGYTGLNLVGSQKLRSRLGSVLLWIHLSYHNKVLINHSWGRLWFLKTYFDCGLTTGWMAVSGPFYGFPIFLWSN